ncbi:MAG: type II toxin-antitoxin system RelE/ParE family toxin [Desulfamplus sp.]|nr:type II toxin-antitoxin system RelE/ParE family toxin [Desulfamplus sp.]
MDSYKIEWKESASKELKKLDRSSIPRIIESIELLANTPYPVGCKKIVGSEHIYRIRVGDYRVIYTIESDRLIIEIIRVGHRKDIYRST